MATKTMPSTPEFFSANFRLVANTQTFRSPLDGTVQTLELTGARWRANYELPFMTRAEAAAWQAFLTSLKGQSGRFFGMDPAARSPRGSALGTPLVVGASETGESLASDGWDINETGLLLPADFFEVNGELKMVTASVDSDGAGAATISFVPSLRASPVNNAPITTTNPRCTMMLDADDSAAWDAEPGALAGIAEPLYAIAFAGVEAFT